MLAIGGLLVGQVPAQAVWQCYKWTEGSPAYRASARCDFGLGGVRVAAYCYANYSDDLYYGPWVSAGGTSTVICGGGKVIDGYWYETF